MENYLQIYLFAAIGVMISVVLPILRALLPQPPPTPQERQEFIQKKVKPYLIVAVFSLISAFLIVASLNSEADCRVALLAGYAWDSTLQKMKGPIESK